MMFPLAMFINASLVDASVKGFAGVSEASVFSLKSALFRVLIKYCWRISNSCVVKTPVFVLKAIARLRKSLVMLVDDRHECYYFFRFKTRIQLDLSREITLTYCSLAALYERLLRFRVRRNVIFERKIPTKTIATEMGISIHHLSCGSNRRLSVDMSFDEGDSHCKINIECSRQAGPRCFMQALICKS